MVRLSYIVAIIGIALTCVVAQEFYDNRYDDVNVDDILANNKLRQQYYKCFMETAPCLTGDAKFFREVFGEAFLTQCRKCTEKQKVILDTIAVWYTTNEPEQWRSLIEKATNDLRKKNANQ